MNTKTRAIRATMLLVILAIPMMSVIFPTQALAKKGLKKEQIVGSIQYTASRLSVIGFTALANSGFEKTATYQFPTPPSAIWTTPFFTDLEVEFEIEDGEGRGRERGRRVHHRNFDTMIVMTNQDAMPVTVDLTFFDQAGMPIRDALNMPITVTVHIPGNGTDVQAVSMLLNQNL